MFTGGCRFIGTGTEREHGEEYSHFAKLPEQRLMRSVRFPPEPKLGSIHQCQRPFQSPPASNFSPALVFSNRPTIKNSPMCFTLTSLE